ncbi:MAG: coenzyme-B sulfoethylthiotransferase subunit beta [Candidatus Helarchaeota archaeon]
MKDVVDIYDDEGNVYENIPVDAFSPLYNPYIGKIIRFIKRTAFISLEQLQQNIQQGRYGEMTALRKDEIQMTQYIRKWNILKAASEIAETVKRKIDLNPNFNGGESGAETRLLMGGKLLMVTLPERRVDLAASNAPLFTITGVALAQAITEIFDVHLEEDQDGCALIKTAIFGRFPQTREFGSNCPLFAFMKPPQMEEGIGTLFRSMMVNHIVALANYRTFDAAALASIFEQAGQFEMGNALGWFERYHLLGMVYQGFNANNLVMDLIKENAEGTVGDVVQSLMKRAIKDGLLYLKSNKYPIVQPSGYKLYSTRDYPLWNAYSVAAALAAVIVNVGASRACQGVSAALAMFSDLLSFASGGLPDPDAGRLMGTALGYSFYTHSIYGGAGPGAFTMDHVITRHTSGFLTPCAAAAMCLDAGTQIFAPKVTSGNYLKLRKELPLFTEPHRKVAEAALKIKNKF